MTGKIGQDYIDYSDADLHADDQAGLIDQYSKPGRPELRGW